MCPLKSRDVCVKVGRLSFTFANSVQHNPSILTTHSCALVRENTHIHRNFHPHCHFFYPSARRLAACIPRIIRILQLLHRTILTNKRHVIRSGTSISFLLQIFFGFCCSFNSVLALKNASSRVLNRPFDVKIHNYLIFKK